MTEKKLWQKIYDESNWDEEAAKSIAFRMEWQGMSREEAEALEREEWREKHHTYDLQVGKLGIDTSHQTVWYDDQPVLLNSVEYRLLLCLAMIPGRVVPYGYILRHMRMHVSVRDQESFLQNHVDNLQQKINPQSIVHVRNVGYMLIDPDAAT